VHGAGRERAQVLGHHVLRHRRAQGRRCAQGVRLGDLADPREDAAGAARASGYCSLRDASSASSTTNVEPRPTSLATRIVPP